jgi:hypothetical protein
MVMPASLVVAVPVGVITGFAPTPLFWKVIALPSAPLAVIAGGSSLKVCPAVTSNVRGPQVPFRFTALMASVNEA